MVFDGYMNFAFYTSGRCTLLKNLIDRKNTDFISDLKFVFSESVHIKSIGNKLNDLGIDIVSCEYPTIGTKEEKGLAFSEQLLKCLIKYDIDYLFCNGTHILYGDILKKYKNKIITLHGAILPSYRGTMQLDKMIANNEFLLGTSAIFIDEGVDTGPIIMEAVIPIQAFYDNGYDIVLNTQIDMAFKIHKLLKHDKIKIFNNKVFIIGADYYEYGIYPKV